jgi:hypothetical protein
VKHIVTSRTVRYMQQMQAQVAEAQRLPDPRRVRALRRVVRQCVHLGLPELAREARHMARAGGVA